MTPIRWLAAALFATSLAACNTTPTRPPEADSPATAHDNLNAVLWMQTAAEYEATVRGVYAAARMQLDRALADPNWSALPAGERSDGFESRLPAIIVDADETMIDNSPFQARGVRDGSGFASERWLAWVNERRARAMPGAVEFARYASERGVTIYFITNRDAPLETESTIANLRELGFPIAADAANVLLRGDPRAPAREKSARRRWVGERHRVLLLLGDNLGDFLDGANSSIDARHTMIARHADWWGVKWFMQPNPSYGSWEAALLGACDEALRADVTACKRMQLRVE
jgi:5'-nucleotidase (lipoprotein e(P4) family)